MATGIYKITNLVNGKVYIGQSTNINRRWKEHCRKNKKALISKAIYKYGKENFSFDIVEECSEKDLDIRESYYINFFNSLVPNGYNIAIIENGEKRYYKRYSKETLYQIIKDIKNTDLTINEIAKKYNLDISMIYYINRGDCHALPTETYPLRQLQNSCKCNHGYNSRKRENYCIDCGKRVCKKGTRCVECSHKQFYKCVHPSREELKELIRNYSFVDLGIKYGVSDKAIVKWCKKEQLPYRKSDINKISDKDWELI